MNKSKKYIYPVIFSVCFIILYAALTVILPAVTDNGSYAGVAFLMLAVSIWAFFITPFYCFKYSKVIDEEKLKFLFATYNAVVLLIIHILPFGLDADTYIYGVIFFIWVVFWSVLPLVLRLIYRKTQDDATSEESCYLTNPLLQNKKQRIIAICFTSFYLLNLILTPGTLGFMFLQDIWQALPLISTALTLVFLTTKSKGYLLKKRFLSVAFVVDFINCLISLIVVIKNTRYFISDPLYIVSIVYVGLMSVAVALMFTGTLFDYKRIKLLKYGTLGCAVMVFVSCIRFSVELSSLASTMSELRTPLARLLFYIGIFILTTNKRRSTNEHLA